MAVGVGGTGVAVGSGVEVGGSDVDVAPAVGLSVGCTTLAEPQALKTPARINTNNIDGKLRFIEFLDE